MRVSTLEIGPLVTAPYNLVPSRSSASNVRGYRSFTLTGDLEAALVDEIEEMVVNPGTRQTIGGHTGSLQYVRASSPLLPSVIGYSLLQSLDSTLSVDPLWPYTRFSLSLVMIGDVA